MTSAGVRWRRLFGGTSVPGREEFGIPSALFLAIGSVALGLIEFAWNAAGSGVGCGFDRLRLLNIVADCKSFRFLVFSAPDDPRDFAGDGMSEGNILFGTGMPRLVATIFEEPFSGSGAEIVRVNEVGRGAARLDVEARDANPGRLVDFCAEEGSVVTTKIGFFSLLL